MITGPLFKWFGSKWSLSKYYPKPTYGHIIEPFAGSAGYSLRYAAGKIAVLAEANPMVRELWKWLICTASAADILEIPINIPEGTDIREIGLSRGQNLLLKHWQRTNNVGNCWTISPWGNKSGQWTANKRSRVANDIQYIKNWRIYHDCGSLLMVDNHDTCATWFIDPPYQYNYDYKFAIHDYPRLGNLISELKGQVIACEAVCPKTGKMPDYLPFKEFRRSVTSRHHYSKELIWSKG